MPFPTHAVHSTGNPVQVPLGHNLEFGDTLNGRECTAPALLSFKYGAKKEWFLYSIHIPQVPALDVRPNPQTLRTHLGEISRLPQNTASQNMFLPHQQHQHHLGTCLKRNFLDLSADLLMQKSRVRPASCLTKTSR